MPSSAWRFTKGSATESQKNFIDLLARKAGYSNGHAAAERHLGYSSSKLDQKGLDRDDASGVIDWLKGQQNPSRTPAQIRATKRLVAMNKARARNNPKKRKPSKISRQMKRAGKALAKWVRSGMPSQRGNPRMRVKPGETLAQAEARAQQLADSTGHAVNVLRRASGEGRSAQWKSLGTVFPTARKPKKRNRAKCNPRRKKGATLTLAQGKKLYELGRRAPKTPVTITKRGGKVSIVTGKAARKLRKR